MAGAKQVKRPRRRERKNIAEGVAHIKKVCVFAVLLLSFVSFLPKVNAFPYDEAKARKYADDYALSRNSNYYYYNTSDCTNFVSQSMFAAGLPMNTNGIWQYWKNPTLVRSLDTASATWTFARHLKDYVKNDLGAYKVCLKWRRTYVYNSNGSLNAYPYTNDSSNIMGKGNEIVFYDWDDDGIIDHSAIITGTGVSADGTGTGDYMDAHSNPRYHTIWHMDTMNLHADETAIYVFKIN